MPHASDVEQHAKYAVCIFLQGKVDAALLWSADLPEY